MEREIATLDQTPGQLEHEIEHTRERMSSNIDALGEKLRPDNLRHQAKEAIVPSLRDQMAIIAGGDASREGAFKTQLVDWYLHRVYDELDGPLTDTIAAIPPQ